MRACVLEKIVLELIDVEFAFTENRMNQICKLTPAD